MCDLKNSSNINAQIFNCAYSNLYFGTSRNLYTRSSLFEEEKKGRDVRSWLQNDKLEKGTVV